MLDEKALRKPGFTDGYSVTLADGQRWTFPKPWFRVYPRRVEGRIAVLGGPSYGEVTDRQINSLAEDSDDPDDIWRRIEIKFQVAAELLLRNYDLDDDGLMELLIKDEQRPETLEAWEDIERVIMGIPPKDRSPSGSDALS